MEGSHEMTRIIDTYLKEFVHETESTTIHHRWCFLSIAAGLLGRKIKLPFGHWEIYPNMYTMLMGEPATRKSSAISIAEGVLRKVGYDSIAKGKTSHEKFLMDLGRHEMEGKKENGKAEDFNVDLWAEESGSSEAHELFVAADEFNNFIGLGNYGFISTLGELWDCKPDHPVRFKNSTSFTIHEPVVNILGGNTQTGFCLAFPPEIIGQGFFSRLLLIHADPSGRRITFPKDPNRDVEAVIVHRLQQMANLVSGDSTLTPEAEVAVDWIYQNQKGIEDARFQNYAGRRLTHMLKLCMIYAALELRSEIQESDVVLANSTLCFAEQRMPIALGEYGKGKNADVASKILLMLDQAHKPLTCKDIWSMGGISSDLNKIQELAELMMNLKMADKVVEHGGGFLIKKKPVEVAGKYCDFELLIENDRR
jgi:hypothetical protein